MLLVASAVYMYDGKKESIVWSNRLAGQLQPSAAAVDSHTFSSRFGATGCTVPAHQALTEAPHQCLQQLRRQQQQQQVRDTRERIGSMAGTCSHAA